jgi:phosphoglycerate dehydrogenase-like enzyme
MTTVKVAIETGPGGARTDSDAVQMFESAVRSAGGQLVDNCGDANAMVWLSLDGDALAKQLDAAPNVKWVQLPWAGVESFEGKDIFDRPITFTCAKASYAGQVGEHAFMLALTALRNVVKVARTPRWCDNQPESVEDKNVTILGAGGIATVAAKLFKAAGGHVTVLRRSEGSAEHADETLRISQLQDVLPRTDILVLALALTKETERIIGARELELLPDSAVLVNVARGRHIDQDALVAALTGGTLRAAGLDVTDPEPLPAEHPLWQLDNVLVTSHSADSDAYVAKMLAARIQANVSHFAQNEALEGVVDPSAGY